MNRLVIWGAGSSGREVLEVLKSSYDIVCFIDNNENIVGNDIDGIEICSPKILPSLVEKFNVDAIILGVSVMLYEDVYEQIMSILPEYDNVFYVPSYWKNIKFIKYSNKKGKSMYPFLGVEAVRACNLKCNACMHFSNVVEELGEYDLGQLNSDFKRLSEIFTDICCIRIAGGEPLLSNNLPKMIRIVKKYFPNCMVELITNGLLLTKINKDLIEAICENEVRVNITLYEPTRKKYDEIEAFCRQNNIPYIAYGTNRDSFSRRLYLKENGKKTEIYNKCDMNRCNIMRYGRITHCALEMHADYINKRYGTQLPENEGYNFYSDDASGEAIRQYIRGASKSCEYCGTPEVIPWSVKHKTATIKDWMVNRVE